MDAVLQFQIAALQRELLALFQQPDTPQVCHDVHQLRVQLLKLDPNGLIYWGRGHADSRDTEAAYRQRVLEGGHIERQAAQLEQAEAQSLYGDEHHVCGGAS